jgi:hypothetical protein
MTTDQSGGDGVVPFRRRHAVQPGRAPLAEHQHDLYDTDPVAVRALLRVERLPPVIWEPACGTGNIVLALRDAGHTVIATDLIDRGCPDSSSFHFLFDDRPVACDAIVTNPPFYVAEPFVRTALERAPLVVMLLRLAFLESERRRDILDSGQLARVHVFRKRLPMMHRSGWTGRRANSGMAFAWFVWERDHQGAACVDRLSWDS